MRRTETAIKVENNKVLKHKYKENELKAEIAENLKKCFFFMEPTDEDLMNGLYSFSRRMRED